MPHAFYAMLCIFAYNPEPITPYLLFIALSLAPMVVRPKPHRNQRSYVPHDNWGIERGKKLIDNDKKMPEYVQ